MKLGQAALIVRAGVDETLSYMAFPREHWTRIRTNNMLGFVGKLVFSCFEDLCKMMPRS